MWWCENLFSCVSFTSAGEAVSCWPLDPIKSAPLIRNLASIRKLALSITPAVLTIRNGAIFFKSENRTVTNSVFLSLKNCRRNFLKGKPGPMTISEHIDTLPVGGRACFPHCRTLNNNLTKTLALKLTWISQKIKMVAFIYIKYESKCSLKIHQSLSQIYQNLPIATFLPPTTPHCFRIDLNNVSSDTPFHGQSSETELHKPFTTRSLWLMAGPPAKAPGPDSPLKNITTWRDSLLFQMRIQSW